MRNAICSDPSRPIRRVYNDVITLESSDNEEDDAAIPDFLSVRSALHRHRQTFYPPIPRSVQDVIVRGQWRRTWKGERFLVHQDPQWGLLIYMSPKSTTALQKCTDLYVDGTFSVCPKPFKQIVTIHGMYKDRVVPFVFCFLQSKNTALYREMFSQVAHHVHVISGRHLNPTNFVCDFEISLWNAIEATFPNASVKGCYFHYCQSIWRNVQKYGLTSAYRRNRSVRNIIKKIMSLGYIPTAIVRNTFNLIHSSQTVARLCAQVPGLTDFIRYFERNYIQGAFQPPTWNVFGRDVDFRTNNHVEGTQYLLTLFKKSVTMCVYNNYLTFFQ
jgi:hypothetical protein